MTVLVAPKRPQNFWFFFNCHMCRFFIWSEKHWYLSARIFQLKLFIYSYSILAIESSLSISAYLSSALDELCSIGDSLSSSASITGILSSKAAENIYQNNIIRQRNSGVKPFILWSEIIVLWDFRPLLKWIWLNVTKNAQN